MKHVSSARTMALGSMGVVVMAALTGCSTQQTQEQGNKFLVFQEDANGKYTVIEEHPTDGPTRAIIKDVNGNERFMSETELKALAQAEYDKMQNGTSELNQAPTSGDSGMGIGGTILAVAAGSLLGNMIANQLMGNKNFSQRSQAATSNVRSKAKATAAKKSSAKKSFFGSNKPSTSKSRSFFGG